MMHLKTSVQFMGFIGSMILVGRNINVFAVDFYYCDCQDSNYYSPAKKCQGVNENVF